MMNPDPDETQNSEDIAASQLSNGSGGVFRYYDRLRRIEQYIAQHYAEELSLAQAATIAGLETKYFSAFFHKKVGVSFTTWLAQVRVKKAIDLLLMEDRAISQVSLDVGFASVRSFERAFKRYTNKTPSQFRYAVRSAYTGHHG